MRLLSKRTRHWAADARTAAFDPGRAKKFFVSQRLPGTGGAFQHPTDLNAIPEASFDHIARHGYELADATLTAYWPDEFSRSLTWT
jgi:hypothetical protein